MNKPSISFIIPYYKVELPLLARAITSILRLGQKADWEVWVINDGTPGHEAEDYLGSPDDPRIHYHVQPNLGLGGARNTGMEMAQKEYIQFLDADDFLFQKAFSQILILCERGHKSGIDGKQRKQHPKQNDTVPPQSIESPFALHAHRPSPLPFFRFSMLSSAMTPSTHSAMAQAVPKSSC